MDERWEEVMEKKIKVYVLEKMANPAKPPRNDLQWVPDGSYAMIYIRGDDAWLQQINYTTEGVEAHTKVYEYPLALGIPKIRSLDTGIEEAREFWKRFVDDGFKRLSLTEGPFHLNTLIDEDIEIIA